MTVTLDNIKKAQRIDYTDDDAMLQNMLDAATQYIIDAVDQDATAEQLGAFKQYDMAVSLLTQFWYTTRGDTDVDHVPTAVTSLIQQLRGKSWQEGTGANN